MICDDKEYQEKLAEVDELIKKDPSADSAEGQRLALLVEEIEKYELENPHTDDINVSK